MENYKRDEEYILEVLKDEKERLIEQLIDILSDKERYIFYRYLAVTNTIKKIK